MRDLRTAGLGYSDGTAESGMDLGFTTEYCAGTGLILCTVYLFGTTDHQLAMHLTVQQAIDVADLFGLAIGDAIETTTDRNEMEF